MDHNVPPIIIIIHVFNSKYNSFSFSCPDLPAAALVLIRIISGVERTGDDP